MIDRVFIINIPREYERYQACRQDLLERGVPEEKISRFDVIDESQYETTQDLIDDAITDGFWAYYRYYDLCDDVPIGYLSQMRNYLRFFRAATAQWDTVLFLQDRRRLLIDWEEVLEREEALRTVDPSFLYLTFMLNKDADPNKPENHVEADNRFIHGIYGWASDWAALVTPEGARTIYHSFMGYLQNVENPQDIIFEKFMLNNFTEEHGGCYTLAENGVTWLKDIEKYPSTLHYVDEDGEELLEQDILPSPAGVLRPPKNWLKSGTAVQIGLDKSLELHYLTSPNWSEDHNWHDYFFIPQHLAERWELFAVDAAPASIEHIRKLHPPSDNLHLICASIGANCDSENRLHYFEERDEKHGMLYEDYEFHGAKISLLELLRSLGIHERHDFKVLKMDIEYAEYEVLMEYSWELKPVLLILEIHIDRSGETFDHLGLINHIVAQGYYLESAFNNDHEGNDPILKLEDRVSASINCRFWRTT